MQFDAKTRLNLVIGNPIGHSKSPTLHHIIYEKLNINAVMLAVENPNLPGLINSIRTLSIPLTAVTLPFKTDILKYVDEQSDAVQALQAANTLILSDNKIRAENTDIDGIAASLKNIHFSGKNVLILGAGGAARAAGYVLHTTGAHLYWLNRTHENAQRLASRWGGNVITEKMLNDLPIDIIINTTPIGMHPHTDETTLPTYIFKKNQIVFDMIYHPEKTKLLLSAEKSDATCISGKIMFIEQALKQVSLFYPHNMTSGDFCHVSI